MSPVSFDIFDRNAATACYPRPIPKYALYVHGYEGFSTDLRPADDRSGNNQQTMFGSYYLEFDPQMGSSLRGHNRDYWEGLYSRVKPLGENGTLWVPTKVSLGHEINSEHEIRSWASMADGLLLEIVATLEPGFVIMHKTGFLEHLPPDIYAERYYTTEEATALGLTSMGPNDFAAWAKNQALAAQRHAG